MGESPLAAPAGSVPGAVARFIEHPDEGMALLRQGRLEVWLRAMAEDGLADRAQSIRGSEPDDAVALQKFLETTGLVEPPVLGVDGERVELGGLVRGEIRTFRVTVSSRGRGLLYGEAVVEGERIDTVRPRRSRIRVEAGDDQALEFVVFTQHLQPDTEVEVPVRISTNGGEAIVTVRARVEARPAALTVPERHVDVVLHDARPGLVEVRMRNDGDRPLEIGFRASEPWVRVGPTGPIPPGASISVAIVVDAAAIPAQDVRHRRKGDRYSVATVRIETPRETVELEVRAWTVRPWDAHAFGFGVVAGMVPFVNLLLGGVLAVDRLRRRGVWRSWAARSYRCRSEARENGCFLLGMIPGVLLHVLTLFGVA